MNKDARRKQLEREATRLLRRAAAARRRQSNKSPRPQLEGWKSSLKELGTQESEIDRHGGTVQSQDGD
jgi:hypothetical protein